MTPTRIVKNKSAAPGTVKFGAIYHVDPQRVIGVSMNWERALSVNARHGVATGIGNHGNVIGRIYLKPVVAAWMDTMSYLIRQQVNVKGVEYDSAQDIAVLLDIYYPNDLKHFPDRDNYWKSVFDAIKVAINVDDHYFIPVPGHFESVRRQQARLEVLFAPVLKTEMYR